MPKDGEQQQEMNEEIRLKPIGVVHNQATDEQVKTHEGPEESTIEIYEEFAEALDGIESYSHLFVLAYFNRLRPEQVGPLRVRPKGLLKRGFKLEELPLLGVFSLDSPTRPNPVGLSLVRLIRRESRNLIVSSPDFFDGTPVIDIKPMQPQYATDHYNLPEWYVKMHSRAGMV
jgi:tRNA (adenine37-N6)-methyltransferase